MKQVVLKIKKIISHDDNGGWLPQQHSIGDLCIIKTNEQLSIGDFVKETIWIESQGTFGFGTTKVEGEVVFI